ncbi:MAG: hypothetical protein HY661_07615 [Betaproteobacteria bacterium]|nr:hypothetical protein [Betaproteobacteria bacterium]
MSDVIGRGVIEVVADARKLKAGIEDAKKSIRTLGEGQKEISKGAQQSIDKYIGGLKMQNATLGKSVREVELYKLALRGASNEQLKVADAVLRSTQRHKDWIAIGEQSRRMFVAIGAIAATSLIAAAAAFDQLVKKAGDFQDMAEKVGDSAEAIASLAVAAAVGGAGMDKVVAASVLLTKNLTGVDDESKNAGAAITALGLNLEDFKNLKPADQFEAVAKALAGFEEGSAKTAVAVALFGKAGADMLPFLKELGAEGGRQTILTSAQIALADEYSDKQKKLTAQIALHAQAIAVEMMPAYSDLQGAFLDLLSGMNEVTGGAADLRNNTGIQDFAETAVRALAFLVDSLDGVYRALLVVGKAYGGIEAARMSFLSFQITQGINIIKEMDADITRVLNKPTLGQKLDERIAARKAAQSAQAGGWDDSRQFQPGARPKLQFEGAAKKDTGAAAKAAAAAAKAAAAEAAQLAKAQLAFDIEQIKKASDATIGTFANAAKIMEAMRAANLIEDKEYYASKLGFLNLNSQAQEAALQKEIERLQQEKLSGKEQIDNARAIADAQARLAKVRADALVNVQVNSIQEAAAQSKIAQSYVDATVAAQTYIDTINRQNEREIAGIGRGTKFREKQQGISAIEDKQTLERQQLEAELRRRKITQAEFDIYLGIVNDTYRKEIAAYEKRSATLIEKEGDWINGATEALQNYYDQASNIAKQVEDIFAKAFLGMEDALVEFTKTGKLDFKSMADSIIADITRMAIKQSITGPLAKSMESSGFLGSISRVLGLGGGSGAGLYQGMEIPEFAEGTASVPRTGLALVHEGERITPKGQNISTQVSVTNIFHVSGPIDRRSQAQISAAAGEGVQRALARNT